MNLSDLRVVFMGTPAFAVPTLEALFGGGCEVVGVVSQPARPAGRGRKVEQTPVGACAERRGVPLFQWPRLNNDSYAALKALAPDVGVVVAYGKILPQRYLDLPRYGCLNGHASVLPKLRGAAPIQWAVLRGHRETGTSIMQMDAGMDTGAVGLTVRTPIGADETAGEVHDRLSEMTAGAMRLALGALVKGELKFTPQIEAHATMAPMLRKSDGELDWRWPANLVHDRVRGASPWPGAYVVQPEGNLKVLRSRLAPGDGAPGTIIALDDDGPRVACGQGAVTLLVLQKPGRRAVPGADFVRGAGLKVGDSI